jgi:4-hydroxybenzoate polyprenyltransferase
MSPMAWGIVMPLLFIAAFPLYLINRNRLRTRKNGNAFFVATIVIGAVLFALSMIGVFLAPDVVA